MALELTNTEVIKYCLELGDLVEESGNEYKNIYPIPMGGFPVAVHLAKRLNLEIVNEEQIDGNTLIVDDLIDSGRTMWKFPGNDKAVLIDKGVWTGVSGKIYRAIENEKAWIIFPWEKTKDNNTDIEDHIVRMLEYIGEDPNREGLLETPKRIVKSWKKLYGGYQEDPKSILKVFESPDNYDEMIILKDIEFYSTCEHHMLNFSGLAHIAYIPNKKVIGVSKLARLLETYARRLQIQERLTKQITNFLMKELKAKGAGCIIEAQHLCTSARGIEKQKSKMVTSSLEGVFRKPEVRQEFINLTRGK